MSITRPTQDYVNERRNAIQQIRALIDRSNQITQLKESVGWTQLKKTLEYAVKENRDLLNQILDRKTADVESDFANCKSLRAAELSAQRVIDDVERGEETVELWLAKIKKFEDDIAAVEKSGALR